MEKVKPSDIRLVNTCGACPEQYDAYLSDDQVAYLRLRHGYFSVETPSGSKLLYSAHPNGDGCFDGDERDEYLAKAKNAIAEEINARAEGSA